MRARVATPGGPGPFRWPLDGHLVERRSERGWWWVGGFASPPVRRHVAIGASLPHANARRPRLAQRPSPVSTASLNPSGTRASRQRSDLAHDGLDEAPGCAIAEYVARMSVDSTRRLGLATVCVAASAWGTWPLFVRHGGQGGLVVGFLTMSVMALPALWLVPRSDFRDRGAVLALVVVGVADAANVALYFSALERGPVVVAVLTHYLAPLLVALTAPLVLSERPSRRARLALPVMLVGLFLVLPRGEDAGSAPWAGLLGAGSALFYAVLVLASRRAAVSFPPLAVVSLHAVVSALLLLLVFRGKALPTQLDGGVALLLVGALLNGLAGAWLFNFGLPRIGAQLTGVLTYLEPLVAAVLGVAVLHEPFSASMALGLGLMLGAGAWSALER